MTSYQPHPQHSSRVSDQHLFQLLWPRGGQGQGRRALVRLLLSTLWHLFPSLASLLSCELLTGLNSSAQLSLSCPVLKADMPHHPGHPWSFSAHLASKKSLRRRVGQETGWRAAGLSVASCFLLLAIPSPFLNGALEEFRVLLQPLVWPL